MVHKEETIRVLGVLGDYPPDELARRRDAMLAAAPKGVTMGFGSIEGSVFHGGLTHLHRALAAPGIAAAALRGQDEGYQAVVPYGTLDLGVEEARHVVDIPVVGPGRTAATIAPMLADRFAVLVYDQAHVTMQIRMLDQWRITPYVTSIRPVGIEITEMVESRVRLRDEFVRVARHCVEKENAQLIVPMGMTMVPVLMSATSLSEEIGVPVLDPLSLSLHVAEGLARTGVSNSRVAYPAARLP